MNWKDLKNGERTVLDHVFWASVSVCSNGATCSFEMKNLKSQR